MAILRNIHFEDIKPMVANGETKFSEVIIILTLSSKEDIKDTIGDLVKFFSENKLTIDKIKLSFKANASYAFSTDLTENSRLLLESLKFLKHIEMKGFCLNNVVKEYVLQDLFCHQITENLTYFGFANSLPEDPPLPSQAFLEEHLVNYLKKNQCLNTLSIYPSNINILSYPQLKTAMLTHPSLNQFENGNFFRGETSPEETAFLSSLNKKIKKAPISVKEQDQIFTRKLQNIIHTLSELDDLKTISNDVENPWLALERFLKNEQEKWGEFKTIYDKLAEVDVNNLMHKKSTIEAIFNFITFLKHLVYLQGNTSKVLTNDRNKLDRLWDIDRGEILKEIIAKTTEDTPDFSSCITTINTHLETLSHSTLNTQLIKIIETLKQNIKGDNPVNKNKTTLFRFTHFRKERKLFLFDLCIEWLNKYKITPENQQTIIDLILTVCKIKRNPIGIFAPTSTYELEKLLKPLNITINPKSNPFNVKEVCSLNNLDILECAIDKAKTAPRDDINL